MPAEMLDQLDSADPHRRSSTSSTGSGRSAASRSSTGPIATAASCPSTRRPCSTTSTASSRCSASSRRSSTTPRRERVVDDLQLVVENPQLAQLTAANVAKNIAGYHSAYGGLASVDEPLVVDSLLPNPIGGDDFPARQTFTVDEVSDDEGCVRQRRWTCGRAGTGPADHHRVRHVAVAPGQRRRRSGDGPAARGLRDRQHRPLVVGPRVDVDGRRRDDAGGHHRHPRAEPTGSPTRRSDVSRTGRAAPGGAPSGCRSWAARRRPRSAGAPCSPTAARRPTPPARRR